jgi:pimeloyl-ACP methyl ester carboxylesterase
MDNFCIVFQLEDLIKFFPAFGTLKAGWHQYVVVVYEAQKKDPKWMGASGHTLGRMVDSSENRASRRLMAKVLVDVRATAAQSAAGSAIIGEKRIEVSPTDFNFKRERVLETLVHELLHVLQSWVRPGGYESADRDAMAKAWGRDFFVRDPVAFGIRRYRGNLYERAAFDRADEFVIQNRERIQAGDYDAYLPIEMIRELGKANPNSQPSLK